MLALRHDGDGIHPFAYGSKQPLLATLAQAGNVIWVVTVPPRAWLYRKPCEHELEEGLVTRRPMVSLVARLEVADGVGERDDRKDLDPSVQALVRQWKNVALATSSSRFFGLNDSTAIVARLLFPNDKGRPPDPMRWARELRFVRKVDLTGPHGGSRQELLDGWEALASLQDDEKKKNVFISYVRDEHQGWCQALARRLIHNGHGPWLDGLSLPGYDFDHVPEVRRKVGGVWRRVEHRTVRAARKRVEEARREKRASELELLIEDGIEHCDAFLSVIGSGFRERLARYDARCRDGARGSRPSTDGGEEPIWVAKECRWAEERGKRRTWFAPDGGPCRHPLLQRDGELDLLLEIPR